MRFRFRFFTVSVFMSLALLLAAGISKATSSGGKFTLPFEAHWGIAVLPPGDYTFTVISPFGSPRYLDVRGKRSGAYIFPLSTEMGTNARRSHLTLVTIGRNHFIERLVLTEVNTAFEFRIPKSAIRNARSTRLKLSREGQGS
ncbi:MAG: hypothetical protein ACRD22_10780 [Terriglobia bacterium]